MPGLVFVTGGTRSGKSAYAERRALVCAETQPRGESGLVEVGYVLSEQALSHGLSEGSLPRHTPRDPRFVLIPEELFLARALRLALEARPVAVLHSITGWLNNIVAKLPAEEREGFALAQSAAILDVVAVRPAATVLVVSNEISLGPLPREAEQGWFQMVLGRVNRQLAEAASEAWLLVSGLPLRLK